MEMRRRFAAANVLIGAGIAPLALWGLLAASDARYGAGFTDIFLLGGFGLVAYVAVILISGAGIFWADRVARTSHAQPPRLTRALVRIVGIVLLAPWILLVISIATGYAR